MLNGAASKTVVFFLCAKTELVSFITARQRIGSTVVSLSAISLAGLLTFFWVMYLNVVYNNDIFLCHGGKECVRKQLSYMSCPSYFAALLQTPYFYYSKVHVVGFLQHFEHFKLVAEYRAEEFSCAWSLSKKCPTPG